MSVPKATDLPSFLQTAQVYPALRAYPTSRRRLAHPSTTTSCLCEPRHPRAPAANYDGKNLTQASSVGTLAQAGKDGSKHLRRRAKFDRNR